MSPRGGDISIHAPRTGSDLPCRAPSFARWHFNPRSPHGERHIRLPLCVSRRGISIHAPRTGSDATIQRYTEYLGISIHAPRTGSDAFPCLAARAYSNFNPRSPHGERQLHSTRTPPRGDISIHAPRTGSDADSHGSRKVPNHFNPRSPHGERPRWHGQSSGSTHFNPRSPHGERRLISACSSTLILFQSTLPARGATRKFS